MSLMTNLLILIVSARLLGQLFVKYKQPAIVGEMLAGVLLGPAVLNFVEANAALTGIADLAVFLVVMSAGLEMNFEDVISGMRGRGLIVALLSFFLPFSAGATISAAFGFDLMRTIFLGLCVSITALPVAIRILESFGMLSSEIGKYSVAASIINDVVALLILGVILNLPAAGSIADVAGSVGVTGGKLIVLGFIIWGVNHFLEKTQKSAFPVRKVPEKLIEIFGNEALFGIVVAFVLMFGTLSEVLGFHFVIGAFFGALLINKDLFLVKRYRELERTIASVTNGFLAPLFFAYIGLVFNVTEMHSVSFVAAVLAISILSKIFAGWMGGRLIGLPGAQALGLGVILNGRGVMELVIASIAFQRGFIGQGMFSTLVLMGVVTTLITPVLFKQFVMPRLGSEPVR